MMQEGIYTCTIRKSGSLPNEGADYRLAATAATLRAHANLNAFVPPKGWPPQAESKYKGLYRNILLQNILSNSRRETSKLTDKGEIEEYQSYVLRLNQGVVQVTKSFMGKKGNIITTTSLLHDQDKFVTNTPEVIAELAFGPDVPISEIMTFEDIWRHTTDSKFIHRDKLNAILKDFKVRLLGTKVPFPTECIEQYPNIFTS